MVSPPPSGQIRARPSEPAVTTMRGSSLLARVDDRCAVRELRRPSRRAGAWRPRRVRRSSRALRGVERDVCHGPAMAGDRPARLVSRGPQPNGSVVTRGERTGSVQCARNAPTTEPRCPASTDRTPLSQPRRGRSVTARGDDVVAVGAEPYAVTYPRCPSRFARKFPQRRSTRARSRRCSRSRAGFVAG